MSSALLLEPSTESVQRPWQQLDWLWCKPWFAYLMLAVVQLKAVWGIWRYRDLTSGDTSSYFITAHQWFQSGAVNIIWSPLYTAFYGSVLSLTPDPYQATILHRLLIVFAASMLVLAVLRQLLPAGLAWLAAAWWVVLPINFNTLYEVHLFAVVPILVAWLVLLSSESRWAHGAGLAVLAASTVLVRNELSVATVGFALACLLLEWRRRQSGADSSSLGSIVAAYGVPLAAAVALCGFFYSRSMVKYPETNRVLAEKHTLNMAQVYAFGYQQRHPEWTNSPWTEYQELLTSHFGEPLPTQSTMIARNPRAVWEHFRWNWELAPNGLQVLMFNATSGTANPDYPPVRSEKAEALWLSIVVLSFWAAGLYCLVRDRRFWWRAWLRPRLMGWVGMVAVAAVAIPVITTQRPRPSYLFSLSVFLIAVTGMCVFAFTRRWRWTRFAPRIVPVVAAVLLIVVPSRFHPQVGAAQRPLRDAAKRLKRYEALSGRPNAVALLGDGAYELSAYVWKGRYRSLDYGTFLKDLSPGAPLEPYLDEQKIDLIYLNERIIALLEHERPALARALMNGDAPAGWQKLGGGEMPGDRWRLYRRPGP